MNRKRVLQSVLVFLVIPVLIVIATYFANVLIISSMYYRGYIPSPTEFLLIEGVFFVLLGVLALIGMINRILANEAAHTTAIAKAAYGDSGAMSLYEIFKEYVWQPKGSLRLGLIMMLAGLFMILAYFLTL